MRPVPTEQSTPEVLIIGAGPSGLTAAVVLAAHGVAARVVDPERGPTDQSRALVVQARTLELWRKLGLADPAIAHGKKATGVIAYSNGTLLNDGRSLIDFATLGAGQTPYPFLLVFEQSKTERLLLDRLTELGGAVDWGVHAHTVRAHDDHVEMVLRHHNPGDTTTEETVTPHWVIGADGASSIVRHTLNLGFDGGSYEQAFFLSDVAVTWPHTGDHLGLALTDSGTFLFVPMPTDPGAPPRYRVLGSLTPDMAARQQLDITDVQRAIDQHSGVRATVSDAKWVSLYRLHHRMAQRFSVGKVFLIGDAAHIHSPVGGQGMNTGIQDAYNLAWKLALVIRGDAQAPLLDSYAAERMPVARALLKGTDNAFNVMVSDRTAVRWGRRVAARLLPFALRHLTATTRRVFATLSQIAITYALSPTRAGTAITGARPGDRAPHAELRTGCRAGTSVLSLLDGPDHHLLLLDQTGTPSEPSDRFGAIINDFAPAIHIHHIDPRETQVHDAYDINAPTAVLIRPDGYIAWRGAASDADGLRKYLATWYTPSATARTPKAAASPNL
ncbi:Pentachlorophenol 4-monooxygenase [Mycobacterium innocens]|uniref:Pentachlorophenol 4-monooxygenase n=1 Tax=Mycobacterium innocens TaxID=2341083 RepID=A0A498PQ72_9MYCO|nr:FAD-dependent monooxygenase [Mycobacterium innocens]VBA34481.1 Pentachlorophenol 4-monooxygenase [Mycobacterium innocens]